MPTTYFIVFSGTRVSGCRNARPAPATTSSASERAGHRRRDVLEATQRDDDEHHFEAFEKDATQRRGDPDPIDPGGPSFRTETLGRRVEGSGLVMEGLQPAGPEDGFMEPLETEEQQKDPDERAGIVDRDARRDGDPKDRNQDRQRHECDRHAQQRAPPSLDDADRQNDRQRLDPLDTGSEGRGDEDDDAHRSSSKGCSGISPLACLVRSDRGAPRVPSLTLTALGRWRPCSPGQAPVKQPAVCDQPCGSGGRACNRAA